ncbi:hypothetical protein H6P81_011725 [Aristolochia fimbriata]|uniref:Casparian strip membrane protein domain-containing protein n=1 Tax=Aristolochia fimbriata TaxID=158543 RepID=A0AAV7E9S5_ARIFI|nr:hypothetical protein H6P81_011725 [Aristolochia fimbriata]
MNASHPAVHPVEAPPLTEGAVNDAPRVRMKDIQGMPGTPGGLALRFFQFVFAVASLCVMASTSDFASVTAFCYLVAAVILQSLWSLTLAMVDIYALLVKRCLRNSRIVSLFTIGDGITSTLTFAAACASAGITVLIGNDLEAISMHMRANTLYYSFLVAGSVFRAASHLRLRRGALTDLCSCESSSLRFSVKMFWRMPALSASSPVEAILDKENFTLEELLDEEEIIQECKALNSRLINFLRDAAQVEQLLRYIVEEPPEEAESKRIFKFPFIACEIFSCEIDVILKTLVEDELLMNLLFSFLEPHHHHGTLLAGYFSKVLICLMMRKTVPLMNYVQAHQDIFCKLVDLIGITSIMEVLVRLVGTEDHMYPNFVDVMQWLADSNLLEMIVDKLSPSSPPEVHANAAETLCAITRNIPSPLTVKISSPSFVERILGFTVEGSMSKSSLIYSLSVCISLLEPKRSSASSLLHSFRSQHLYEPAVPVNPETISAMLPKLGHLLQLLNVTANENVLPTTYGELRPPLGKHRLKIVEFIAVLLKTGNDIAEKELVCSGAIQRVLELFFEFPFNNALHHHVESIILSCLECNNHTVVDHLFRDCNLITKFVHTDKHPVLSDSDTPTFGAVGRKSPRVGNIGHITRIANKIVQLANGNNHINGYLQENSEWLDWQTNILQERNTVENVYRWACGRPSALHDRTRDSDDEELHDRDYDASALADHISNAFRYNNMYDNEDGEEVHGSLERDDEDVYFDDESAEVVISSLRLGDDHESCVFTNSNWFAFQEDRVGNEALSTSSGVERMDDINLNGTGGPANGGSSSDDEVVVGEEEELAEKTSSSISCISASDTSTLNGNIVNGSSHERVTNTDQDAFGAQPEWVGWRDSTSDFMVGVSDGNPFKDEAESPTTVKPNAAGLMVGSASNGPEMLNGLTGNGLKENEVSSRSVPSLFEEDVEFVGVELEGTEKAMDQALKEGIVGEAGPLRRNLIMSKIPETSGDDVGILEFNDTNYWRVEQELGVVQE